MKRVPRRDELTSQAVSKVAGGEEHPLRGLFAASDDRSWPCQRSKLPAITGQGEEHVSGEGWTKQVPVFAAAGYRTITYDRRGFCRSDEPRSDTVTTASPRT
ncbi:hypothetical protein GCM10010910_29050 [Microbacterium nanhaiense]|uniref:AB hydrolase-1 domain-containing protein n=1 Tax=Microbacterium nanhaiense TaxID=1301026 RepID=A0ABQ2N4X1_9MICO|nr:hypothetical protein GCM10010910_29050 [Microbacterium nanhaiense]